MLMVVLCNRSLLILFICMCKGGVIMEEKKERKQFYLHEKKKNLQEIDTRRKKILNRPIDNRTFDNRK